jgi:hypothetical protein
VGVDYVATFNNTAGVSDDNLKTELASSLDVSNNGTFLGDLKLSEETDPTKANQSLTFSGKVNIHCPILIFLTA